MSAGIHIVNTLLLHVLYKLRVEVPLFWSALPVDVSTAALPMQVPPAATAILPMDLRVVDHHHQQQPPFGLVSQTHPTTPASTTCPTSAEQSRGSVISKWDGGVISGCCCHVLALRHSDKVLKISYRPPGAAAAAGAGCSQTQTAAPETATDR